MPYLRVRYMLTFVGVELSGDVMGDKQEDAKACKEEGYM